MKKYKNKINKIRSFALSLIFIGFVIMYGAIFFRENQILVLIFMTLGLTLYYWKYSCIWLDWFTIYSSSSSCMSKLR